MFDFSEFTNRAKSGRDTSKAGAEPQQIENKTKNNETASNKQPRQQRRREQNSVQSQLSGSYSNNATVKEAKQDDTIKATTGLSSLVYIRTPTSKNLAVRYSNGVMTRILVIDPDLPPYIIGKQSGIVEFHNLPEALTRERASLSADDSLFGYEALSAEDQSLVNELLRRETRKVEPISGAEVVATVDKLMNGQDITPDVVPENNNTKERAAKSGLRVNNIIKAPTAEEMRSGGLLEKRVSFLRQQAKMNVENGESSDFSLVSDSSSECDSDQTLVPSCTDTNHSNVCNDYIRLDVTGKKAQINLLSKEVDVKITKRNMNTLTKLNCYSELIDQIADMKPKNTPITQKESVNSAELKEVEIQIPKVYRRGGRTEGFLEVMGIVYTTSLLINIENNFCTEEKEREKIHSWDLVMRKPEEGEIHDVVFSSMWNVLTNSEDRDLFLFSLQSLLDIAKYDKTLSRQWYIGYKPTGLYFWTK